MRHVFGYLILLLSAASLAACSADDSAARENSLKPDQGSSVSVRFKCQDFGALEVRFLGPDRLQLFRSGEAEVLTRERSASGARYANADTRFWNKGDEALLTIDGRDFHCVVSAR
ncbi:MliC family protein [Zhongshania aquimaris]|uniref:MliC family protein n=1 Tax=Zhongshania aquimaris TaxID=2857107 RepID=A0ABS6VNC8_9GAMM|nr:MliC family protein [Zhongshania aquimaris]